MKYIAFLRGINVGGKKSVKMADLRAMFESLEFTKVETYIQSGNVIFEYHAADAIKLENKIKEKINRTFGFEVEIFIRTEEQIVNIMENNPFLKEDNIEPEKLHVTFLSNIPEQTASVTNIKKEENEKFFIMGKEIYLYCPNGYGNTKLNNSMLEKKLKIFATTRNWNTVNKLVEMVKS